MLMSKEVNWSNWIHINMANHMWPITNNYPPEHSWRRTLIWAFALLIVSSSSSIGAPCDAASGKTLRMASLLVRNTSAGLVEGRFLTTDRGVEGLVFMGIRYAEAPIDELRFSPPRRVRPWEGVMKTTEYGPSCYYNISGSSHKTRQDRPMSEDCLLLNVFTTERCVRQTPGNCSVLYYIYGGGFTFGATSEFIPEFIVDNFGNVTRDVVVVTVGYRMNAFGLLNLNHKLRSLLLPNLAIHDLLEGLRWTQREISNFGGDPNRVTLMGHSSGSSAVQLLMVCPKAQPYFSQTISMSGPGVLEPLPRNRNEHASRQLAYEVDCVAHDELTSARFWESKENVRRVLECLRAIPAKVLSFKIGELNAQDISFRELSSEPADAPDAIIPGHYLELMHEFTLPYPVLTGTVSKEYLDAHMVVNSGAINPALLHLYCRHVINEFNYERKDAATKACVREYNDLQRVDSLLDDARYYAPVFDFAKNSIMRTGQPKVFLYQFEYEGIGGALSSTLPGKSPSHSQDLVYLFGLNIGSFTEKDRRIQYLYSQVFANFINNGNPNGGEIVAFAPLSLKRMNYYKIDFPANGSTAGFIGDTPDYHRRAVKFWNEFMPNVGGSLLPFEDEAQLDNKLLPSGSIREELEVVKRHFAPLIEARAHASMWRALFFMAGGLLLFFLLMMLVLMCVAWGKKQRERNEYLTV